MRAFAAGGDDDVTIFIGRGLPPSGEKRAERDIAAKIARGHGKIAGGCRLTDGTIAIHAFLPQVSIKEISEDPHVEKIERTAYFSAS